MTSTSIVKILAISLVWQALIFAALFLFIHISTRNYSKKFIAFYMLANTGYFGITWLAYFDQTPLMRYVYPFAIPLLLCHLPFFYWYIRTLTDIHFRVKGKQWLHLLPALIILTLQMAFFLLPESQAAQFLEKDTLSDSYSSIRTFLTGLNRFSFYVIFTIQFVYYIMKYRKVLQLYRSRIGNVFSYTENIDLKWLHTLMIGLLCFFVGNDLSYIVGLKYDFFSALFFSLGMILINFYIGFHSLVQSEEVSKVFASGRNGAIIQPVEATLLQNLGIKSVEGNGSPRYKRSSLKSETRAGIITGLNRLMNEEELYTDTKLSIDDVAQRLAINSKYLSQSINEEYNRNFYLYVNELRVEKAKTYLCAEPQANYSIEGIARQVGFQSKSSFYIAFKRITGVTPSAFRALVEEKSGLEQDKVIPEEMIS